MQHNIKGYSLYPFYCVIVNAVWAITAYYTVKLVASHWLSAAVYGCGGVQL